MNTENLLMNEINNLAALDKEKEQTKEIYSTDKLRSQLLPSVVKGIIKTGNYEINIIAGLFGCATVLGIDALRVRFLDDIERRRLQIIHRIEHLLKNAPLIALPKN